MFAGDVPGSKAVFYIGIGCVGLIPSPLKVVMIGGEIIGEQIIRGIINDIVFNNDICEIRDICCVVF